MTDVADHSQSKPEQQFPRCVPWQGKYQDGVLGLFLDVGHKRKLWDWQFESNPFSLPFSPVVMVDDQDQVVGFNGVMPVMAEDAGVERPVLWSCDFFLAEAWRGKGLGSEIKHELHQKSPIIMAFGISDRASDVLQHLGWVSDTSVESYRMIRRISGWRTWVFVALQLANRVVRGAWPPWKQRGPEAGMRLSVHSFLPGKDRVDNLWRSCAGGYERIVVRNYKYLDWRYQQHPLGRYAFVRAERAGELAGILVVRTHGEHLRIVDYLGPCRDHPLKKAMIDYVVSRWRHVTQMSAVTSDDQFGDCLGAAGFIRMRGKPRFFRYEAEPSDRKWFIMAGDSDGEFLQAGSDFCDRGAL
ncbi:hypothetical protein [Marinobacter confluentis]|uniref:GNAT family N-acetyltransferase n=1 Tax=Marinobacter confluentis TaxID=1697557 RepID=A0A4Z1BVY7_9GAMM|nr:hypothetical protein [Marinobacter confluentis]TGN41529.1 hypothetical protein E5Q11_03065 [Marinobacter confluentis]